MTGALGDSITVLPILVALGTLTPLPLPQTLALFGVFQIVWGVRYGIPISVEPMKALAGLAIAGAIGYGEPLAAGLLAGAVLFAAGRTGILTRLARYVGDPAVRGVQLAVALVLAVSGVQLAVALVLAVSGVQLAVALVLAVSGVDLALAGPKLAAVAVVVTLVAGVAAAFPTAVLGVLLGIVAIQLGRSAATTDAPLLTLGVGLLGVLVNVGVAFIVAVGLSALRRRRSDTA